MAPGSLFNSAGLDRVTTQGNGPIRGARDLNGLLYVVSGPNVYSLTQDGIPTLCGVIGAGTGGPVSMFDNNQQLMIVDGTAGWLVPGGFPFTGGTITEAGGLYALNDTIQLQPDSGQVSSYPVITVTAISNTPVTTYALVNNGTTYNSATNVATTPINGQPGAGTGLTVDITAGPTGAITALAINAGGTGYAVNDTGTVNGGSQDAAYRVTAVFGGVVTGLMLTYGGEFYSTASGIPTSFGPGQPANAGLGFTLDITASAGPISASVLHSGGKGYVVGNIGFISGGTGDATYLVTAIGLHGGVAAFTVTVPGAMVQEPLKFTQRSTSGSGANFELSNLTFGAFIGLVPVILPAPNPIMGVVSDGFGLIVFSDSPNIYQSDQLDLSTWQPLVFGVADQATGTCLAIGVVHDQVYINKTKTTEVWANAGLAGFAFQKLASVQMEAGTAAPFSLTKLGESLIWISRNDQGQGIVVMAQGYTLVPISTQPLTAEFSKYANIGDAIGFSFMQDQHVFYFLTFPEANATWLYDFTSSQLAGYSIWSRLGAWKDGKLDRHWGNCFWNWRGSPPPAAVSTSYNPEAVKITSPAHLQSPSGLNGLPTTFHTAVLSLWVLIQDGQASGVIFSNQTDDTHVATNPGLFVSVQNDAIGSPQITIEAWDAANALIVTATYDFAVWAAWTNLLASIDTATQVLQVYANTIVGGLLVETALTPASITWHSSNAIAPSATQPWHLSVVTP